jgi:acyl carrier protein
MSETLDRLNDVFKDVFEEDDLEITRDTTAKDIDGWDSMMHVTLVINIEKAFGMRFKSSEVAGLSSVGDLVDLIDARTANA